MGPPSRKTSRSPRKLLCALGVVAWLIAATSTIFTILDATTLAIGKASFTGLAITAAVLNVVALLTLFFFLIQYVWRQDKFWYASTTKRWILAGVCISPAVVSVVLTLITTGLIKQHLDRIQGTEPDDWVYQVAAKFSVAAISILAQAVFYVTALLIRPTSSNALVYTEPSLGRDSVLSETREPTNPTSLRIFSLPYARENSLPSPTHSVASTYSLASWRSSIQHVVRPVTSRTKLIGRNSLNVTRDSKSSMSETRSMEAPSQTDAFDQWDTSSVDPQSRDAVMQSVPYRGTALEPIPGSRPNSPARALEGPFPLQTPSGRSSPLPESPFPPFAQSSRPASPSGSLSEAHIHPLFRTDSPTPPPAASPGTIVTAPPLGGQAIPCPPGRPYSRMRSTSRTASPSPLMHSQSFYSQRSRSSSPVSRKMTPPIPDPIHPLTSLSRPGSAMRKASLQSQRSERERSPI